MIVIADTSPLNYLVPIQEPGLLPRLFGQVLIPPAVWEELNDPDTPAPVRAWLAQAPSWRKLARTIEEFPSEPDEAKAHRQWKQIEKMVFGVDYPD